MKLAIAAAFILACNRRPTVTTCDDNLHGVWLTPSGERWMILDNGGTLEIYPLFDDAVPEGAPRVIDLRRTDQVDPAGSEYALHLGGDIKRRYMRRANTCDARAAIRVTACKESSLQLVLSDVSTPLTFAPCTWPRPSPSRIESWRRE